MFFRLTKHLARHILFVAFQAGLGAMLFSAFVASMAVSIYALLKGVQL